ncbi:hypothetical protein BXY75_1008, partial [Ulvibacter antarcticus]
MEQQKPPKRYTKMYNFVGFYYHDHLCYLSLGHKKSPNSFELGLKEGGDLLFH